jgi:hypothetical protein
MSAIQGRKWEQWVLAAEQLVYTSNQHVMCPECGTAGLRVRDMEYGSGPSKGLSRYLICTHCGCYNAVTMRRAGALIDRRPIAAE